LFDSHDFPHFHRYSQRERSKEKATTTGIFSIYNGVAIWNIQRVVSIFNPFRVEIGWDRIPRVERHKAPLNPGL
jgi:hypothetical protein